MVHVKIDVKDIEVEQMTDQELQILLGLRIQAIKDVRIYHGLSLKEAKNLVDELVERRI